MSVLKTNIMDHIDKYERVVKSEHVDGYDFVFTDWGFWYAKKIGLNRYTSYAVSSFAGGSILAKYGRNYVDSLIKKLLSEALDEYEKREKSK